MVNIKNRISTLFNLKTQNICFFIISDRDQSQNIPQKRILVNKCDRVQLDIACSKRRRRLKCIKRVVLLVTRERVTRLRSRSFSPSPN